MVLIALINLSKPNGAMMNKNNKIVSELRIRNHTSSEEAGIKKLEGGNNNLNILAISNSTSDNAVPDSIQNVQNNKEKSV